MWNQVISIAITLYIDDHFCKWYKDFFNPVLDKMKQKLLDPDILKIQDDEGNCVGASESYKDTVKRCLSKAKASASRIALNLSILRKNTESMIKTQRNTLTHSFSSNSRLVSNYLVDELQKKAFSSKLDNMSIDSESYLDNIYWHPTVGSLEEGEFDGLMS